MAPLLASGKVTLLTEPHHFMRWGIYLQSLGPCPRRSQDLLSPWTYSVIELAQLM